MSPEALVLGLLSAVRTVPMAIVYGLLLAEHPRRLVSTYIAAGVAVSLVVGVTAVVVLEPEAGTPEQGTGRSALDLVLGVLALAVAVAYGRGWIGGRGREPAPSGSASRRARLGERLRRPTVRGAALAGAVTNLPGLYFLAGLVAILATQPSAVGGAVQVGVYTVLRFGGPIAALVLVVLNPEGTVEVLRRLDAWVRRRRRFLVGGVLGAVGLYLVTKATAELLA